MPRCAGRALVEAAGGAVARAVERARHRLALAQFVFQAPDSARLGVLAGRNAHHALEGALQVEGAEMDGCAQAGERRWFLRVGGDGAADALHERHLRVADNRLLRVAAAAGAESCLLGRFREREEGDILAPGSPRRAGGAAVNPRRADGVDERAVRLAVAREHCVPLMRLVPYGVLALIRHRLCHQFRHPDLVRVYGHAFCDYHCTVSFIVAGCVVIACSHVPHRTSR